MLELITVAAGLMTPGEENPEYLRGMAELIAYTSGLNGDDVPTVTKLILSEVS